MDFLAVCYYEDGTHLVHKLTDMTREEAEQKIREELEEKGGKSARILGNDGLVSII